VVDPHAWWWCAMSATLARNYARDGGRPPDVGLQEQASNHRKLRRLRAGRGERYGKGMTMIMSGAK
jgi:hypothetical protein